MLIVLELIFFMFTTLGSGVLSLLFFNKCSSLSQQLSVAGLCGILLTYLQIVFLKNANLILAINTLLTLAPLYWVRWQSPNWSKQNWVLAAGFLIAGLQILFEPLKDWDARSIWFFHTHLFHYNQLQFSDYWNQPELAFSHPHYPHFFSLLTAYLLTPLEHWNSLAPKFSLFVFLIPMIFTAASLLSFVQRPKLWIFALIGLPGTLLWNGYLDGYLAVYFVLGLLAWIQTSPTFHFLSGLCLALCVCLKQEGLALVFCFSVSLLLLDGSKQLKNRKNLLIFSSAIFFFAVHFFLKSQIDAADYLLSQTNRWQQMGSRLSSGSSLFLILKEFFNQFWTVFAFYFLSRWFYSFKFLKLNIFTVTALLYLGVLFFVYLSTDFDLKFYLDTSVKRVCLVAQLLLITTIFSKEGIC